MGEGIIYNQTEVCILWLHVVSISGRVIVIGSLSIITMETRI